jgi:flagellar protein FlaI
MELLRGKKNDDDELGIRFELQCLTTSEYLNGANVLERYDVGEATVTIAERTDGKGVYLIDEPEMTVNDRMLYSQIMKQMFLSVKPLSSTPDEKVHAHIKEQILSVSNSIGLGKNAKHVIDKLMYYVIRDMVNYGVIGVPMLDPDIEDIMAENFNVNVGVIHRRFSEYGILDTNIMFSDTNKMNAFVQKLVQRCSKTITAAVPYVDAITDEGHRISATFGKEISLPGPNFTIRKFSSDPFTITNLINLGTLNSLLAAYIWLLIDVKAFLLIIGPTAAGKTTTIGAIISMMHPSVKVTTIEDTPELRIPHEHWQRLITRKGYSIFESKYDIDMNSLVKLALRSRPDYIIVGEVRGEEASSLVQAVATGHGGLTSFHASDSHSALVRLGSPPLNVQLAGQMLIWCFIRQNRLPYENGKMIRRIMDVTEVIPRDNSIELKKVFEWNPVDDTYTPKNIDDLAKLSTRLREILTLRGYTEESLKQDLRRRQEFLEHLVTTKKEKFIDVSREFARFHLSQVKKQ